MAIQIVLGLAVALFATSVQAQLTWTSRPSGTTANLWSAISASQFSAGMLVAVGEQGTILTSSDEGATWVPRSSGTSAWLTAVTFDSATRRFFAVGEGGVILSSPDAIAWVREVSPTTVRLNAVASGSVAGTMWAIGEVGAGLLVRDATGVWARYDVGFTDRSMRSVFLPYAFGQGGAVFAASTDVFSVWQRVSVPVSADLEAAVKPPFSGGASPALIVVGAGGAILQNAGTGFVARFSGTGDRLRSVCYKGGGSVTIQTLTNRVTIGEYFAVGDNGTILRSADGTAWQPDVSISNVKLSTIVSTQSTVVVFGDGGTIIQKGSSSLAPTIAAQPTFGYDSAANPFIQGVAVGDGALTYLWVELFNGVPFTVGLGYQKQLLSRPIFPDGSPIYQLIAGNAFGVIRSNAVFAERFYNLSSRALVGAGEKKLIGGFSIAGTAGPPRSVLIRAVGPALGSFGLASALKATRLSVYSGQTVIATNVGWQSNSDVAGIINVAQKVGAFPLPSNSADSVLLLSLAPGNYTAQVESVDGSSGVALLEIYDADSETPNHLGNVSARAQVQSGENILIGGLAIAGGLKKHVLLRASGPALAAFGVGGVLAKPQLTLFQGANAIATAVNWSAGSDAADLRSAFKQVGAFAFPEGSADAALLLQLDPGAYTIQVTGADGGSGVALVEVYELPN